MTPIRHRITRWAFFPSQFLGGIDFDRSPGTASTIGPTPFGGSIHLLSRQLSSDMNVRGGVSYGSFNTILYEGDFDSGSFGPAHKANLQLDIHHLQSDGYQTFNFQNRNGGELKAQYKFSDKTYLTGFAGVIWLDANTPNFSATRCQMFGAGSGYTCTGSLAPFAGSGVNFLMTNNSDPTNYLDYQYNYYHVPTDFEYVGLHTEFGKNFLLDVKPFTYNYDNSEKYTNAVPITELTTLNGATVQPCNVDETVKKLTHKALVCGVDKYNSYRKYGETATLSQVSHFGILRTGLWFERAATNRHQYPSDPLNHWADDALPNFAEQFWANSYQPFAEYEFHVGPKLNITPGVKIAYYTINLTQHADNGKTIGDLGGGGDPTLFVKNSGSYYATLPAIGTNYRIKSNWSAYGQLATGSIVPPSSVYDFNQTPTAAIPHPGLLTPPKQQRSTTYQFGSVVKLKRVTLDADVYHIRFQNSYSTLTDPTTGEQVNFLQPSSISQGFEAESNINFGHGLGAYLNATVGRATYTGLLNVAGTLATAPQLAVAAPSGLWVANTPSDTEAEGVTYQRKGWDLALFNKRVGTMYQDNGAYHNQARIDPFSVTNAFLNYTIRGGSRFNQTKLRLSFNNLMNQHSVTSDSITGGALTQTIAANGTTYVDPFRTTAPTPVAGADQIGVLPGRSIMLSVTFGLSPRR
jgi:iron complex outermembrane recepter protein